MSEIEETSKVINDDIGSWYFGYTLLKSTKLDITNYRIFKLTSWIKKRNQINEIKEKFKSMFSDIRKSEEIFADWMFKSKNIISLIFRHGGEKTTNLC